uniref:Uncharacterized protein n=1 Tax=Onchocerca volvulus TaxID=6282 RepID=A0A8R1XND1_ONCVO
MINLNIDRNICYMIFPGHMITTNGTDGKIELSDELKIAISAEVRAQIVPVVKEIVHEVVTEIRSVMTEVMAPIYDELNRLRTSTTGTTTSTTTTTNGSNTNNTLQMHAASAAATSITTPATVVTYPSDSAILAEVYAATNNVAVTMGGTACADAATAAAVAAQNAQLQQFLKENASSTYNPNKGKMYMEDGVGTKNPDDFVEQPSEPRARESTSDCAAYNYVYYNTASAVPIMSMLEPGSNACVCQKVPSIFLGKEGGKISFLVDTRTVPLKDLTADNLGSWTCRFTAHMKSRKYMVKKGKVIGHVKQYGQIYSVPHDYDYILHRQYYCHGNTIGPATIRKNIWYLSNKLHGGEVIGCAIISYEIGDNATVKISKLRQRTLLNNSSENLRLLKAEISTAPEEMDVSHVVMDPNAELQRFVSNIQVPQQ